MIRLMSDCLLRLSEVVAVNVEDIQGNTLTVQRSKTDQTGEGSTLYIGDETKKLIARYCEVAGIVEGALFRRIRRGDHIQAGSAVQSMALGTLSRTLPHSRGSKALSPGIPFVSVLPSHWRKRGRRLLRCNRQADGSRHRCQPIMLALRRQRGARWHDTGIRKDSPHFHLRVRSSLSVKRLI